MSAAKQYTKVKAIASSVAILKYAKSKGDSLSPPTFKVFNVDMIALIMVWKHGWGGVNDLTSLEIKFSVHCSMCQTIQMPPNSRLEFPRLITMTTWERQFADCPDLLADCHSQGSLRYDVPTEKS